MSSSHDLSTPENIANAVRAVAADDVHADLSGVTKAVERADAERKSRLVTALRGAADLKIMAGTKARRFVIAYFYGGKDCTVEGVVYEGGEVHDEKNYEYRVSLQRSPAFSVDDDHRSMQSLKESLDKATIPYHIAYFDK